MPFCHPCLPRLISRLGTLDGACCCFMHACSAALPAFLPFICSGVDGDGDSDSDDDDDHPRAKPAVDDPILGVSSWRAPTCRRCPLSCPGQLSEASCCCAPRHPCTNMHAQQWSFGSAFGMIYYYCSSCNAAQPLDERLQYYIYIWKSCNIYM